MSARELVKGRCVETAMRHWGCPGKKVELDPYWGMHVLAAVGVEHCFGTAM